MSQHTFQTEVSQLLHLIIHSLYSQKEIFLRELISNSSDALDKLRYLTLINDEFKSFDFDPKVHLEFLDDENPTLTITDSGIGMSKKELQDNLGTIARSGTKNFLSKLSGDSKQDSNLIGEFGVGFYSCFMVADKVQVSSKKAGNKQAWKWISDGNSGYEISKDVRSGVAVGQGINSSVSHASKLSITSSISGSSTSTVIMMSFIYPTVSYGSETWAFRREEKQFVDTRWMRRMRQIKRVRRNNQPRKERIRVIEK